MEMAYKAEATQVCSVLLPLAKLKLLTSLFVLAIVWLPATCTARALWVAYVGALGLHTAMLARAPASWSKARILIGMKVSVG